MIAIAMGEANMAVKTLMHGMQYGGLEARAGVRECEPLEKGRVRKLG